MTAQHDTDARVDEAAVNVLVVDDDGQLRQLVSKFLRANGYRVTLARDGVEMAEALRYGAVDLVILDLMLPGRSGLDLCRDLRRTSDVPVIMLTARGEETDRIVGLEVGADDYLAKPFNPRELLARIKAVLRRTRLSPDPLGGHTGRIVTFDGWRLDTMRRELTDPHGIIVDLSTGEYELLLTFLEAPNRVLSRDYLLDAARNRAADAYDRSIDMQVSRLRRKIEPGEGAREMIKTVRGAGYMFLPKVGRA